MLFSQTEGGFRTAGRNDSATCRAPVSLDYPDVMNSPFRRHAFALAVLLLGLLAQHAAASHFRFANLSWKRASGTNALAVELTVTEAWRTEAGGTGEIAYSFGDDSQSFTTAGATRVAALADTAGEQYEVWRYTTTHVYPSNGVFTVTGSSCCRIGSLVNASSADERLTMVVDLRNGNTGSPVTAVPVILQMQAGTNNSIALPIVDPDGDGYQVRMATLEESSISTIAMVGTNALTVTSAGVLNWNTVGGGAQQKFAVQVIIEENRAGNTSGSNGLVPLDFIVELVGSLTNQPPSAAGTNGSITLLPNQTFTTTITGTDPEAGPLLVNHQGLPPGATISPADGTTTASPTPVTFTWTPTAADAGSSYAVLIFFTDQGGQQAVRSFALTVAATVRTNDFDLISVRAVGAGSGNGPSLNPVLSTNGLLVAFVSDAADLVAGDSNGKRDVFWRDRVTGTTRLVSRTAVGTSGNGESDSPAISPDGRYVAFHSRASDLVAGDTNASHDVFVWDSQNDTVTLVSRTPAGRSGAGDSFAPKLAASGRTVIFLSTAGDLVSQDTNNTSDVFSFNLDSSTMTLVSVNRNGFSGNGACGVPVMSADGRHVAFLSQASDLVTNDFNTFNDVFVRDLQTGITRLVSVNAAGTGSGNRLSFDPVMSADGRIIAFGSQATNLVTLPDTNNFPDVFVRDMQLGSTRLASVNRFGTAAGGNNGVNSILPASFNPFVSADGSKVLFTSLAQDLAAGDSNAKQDIFLYDVAGQTNTLISVNKFGTGSGNGASGVTPQSLSTDGRYVAFYSDASDIGSADLNGRTDVFLRDLATNGTKIISRAKVGGFAGNGNSYQPVMSADGSTVLFTSDADNFVANDSNSASDIFTASSALGAPEFGPVDLGMGLSAVGSQIVGTVFNVVLSVTNLSANPATGLGVSVFVPAALDVSSATASQGTSIASTGVWQIGDLAAGARVTLTLSLRPLALAISQVSASVIRLDQPDSDLRNNSTITSILANRTAAGAVFHLSADTAYLSRTNSPYFAGLLAGSFTLEDFESGGFNLAGVTASAGSVLAPSANTDSVDADDGLVDGSGNGGRSFFVSGTNAVTFTFNPVVLGQLPTKVGIVLTDGDNDAVGIEAFDTNGVSLGITSPAGIGDDFFAGETAEDRFLGVEFAGGISALRVYHLQAGFEVDHLQFDVPTTDLALGGSAPAFSLVGSNFAITFNVTNLGPAVVTNAAVTNANPGSLNLVSSAPSQGSFDGGPGIWSIGNLAVGGTASLTLTLSPITVGPLGFSARVLSELADRNTGNDLLTATVLVPNQSPTATLATNLLVVPEDAGPQTFAGFGVLTGTEPGQAIASINVTNSNPALFAVQPTVGLNGTLTLTPAVNANGTALVTLVLQDNGGTANGGVDQTTNSFTLTVAAVNDAPSLAFTTNLVVVLEDASAVTMPGFATAGVGPVNESGQSITNFTVRSLTPTLFSVQPAIALDGTLTFRSAFDREGSAVVEVVAQDDGGTASGGVDKTTNTFTITVTGVNDPPFFSLSTVAFTVLEDSSPFSMFGMLISPNGGPNEGSQSITNYTVTPVGAAASLFSVQPVLTLGGNFTFTPAPNTTGTGVFYVRAFDNGGTANGGTNGSGIIAVTLTVNPVNDAPSFTLATNSITLLEDSGAFTYPALVTGISPGPTDEAAQTVAFAVTTSSNALFSVLPSLAANGTLSFTPAANAVGTALLSIVATDSGGTADGGVNSSTQLLAVAIGVTPVNDAPSFTLATNNVVGIENVGLVAVTNFIENLNLGPTDEAVQRVTNFVVLTTNSTFFAVLPAVDTNGTLTFTAAPNSNGVVTLSVQAFDDGGTANGGTNGSALTNFTITITPVNQPPSFTFSIFSLGVAEDNPLTTFPNLIASFNPGPADESGQTVLGYTVTNDNPGLFAIQPAVDVSGTLTFQGAPNATGSILVSVVAQDSGGTANGGNDRSASATFFIILQEQNDAPSFTFASNTVTALEDAGSVTVANFIASSSVGPLQELGSQTITNYTVTTANSSLFSVAPAIGTNGTLTFTPAADASGATTFTVVARDNGGTGNGGQPDSAPQNFTITLTPVNDAPGFVLVASSNQTVETAAGAVVVPGFVASSSVGPANESGQAITNYQVSAGNATLFTVAPAIGTDGTLTFTVAGLVGSATVSVAARDDGGVANGGTNGSALQTFTIAINQPSGSTPVAYVWQSGTGNWRDQSQWLPNGVPGTNDSATISAGTVQLTNGVAVASLTFAGGTIDGAGSITVRTNMAWTAGSMAGSGTTTIATGATLVASGADTKTLLRTLDNYGTVTCTDSGTLAGNIADTVVLNQTNALFDIQQTSGTLFGTSALFTNWGTLRKSLNTSSVNLAAATHSSGLVHVQSGALNLVGGGSFSGTSTNESGQVFAFSTGNFDWLSGAKFVGAGVGRITTGATVTIAANVTATVAGGGFQHIGGTLTGPGNFLVLSNTTYIWQDGTISGTGVLTVTNTGTISVVGAGDNDLRRTLDNYGRISWGAGRLIGHDGATINNYAGALFETSVAATLFESGDATVKTLNNFGTVRKITDTGTSTWLGLFNNAGTVGVVSGTLALTGGGQSSGAFTNATGAVLEFAGGTQVLTNGASFSGAGTNRINGGTVNVLTNVTVTATGLFELVAGTLAGDGVFSAPAGSQLSWKGGVMGGAGTTTIAAGATLVASEVADKSLNRRLDNYGTVTWTGGRIIGDNGPVLNNFAGALFDTQTDTTLFDSNDATVKTFNNTGTVRKSVGTGTSTWNGAFNNNALVDVQTGTLHPVGSVTLNTSTYSGAGRFLLTGCTVAGTLTNVSGSNVEFAGGTLSGTGTIIGTLNWTGGTFDTGGTLTIASNSVLVASGLADKSLNRRLDNYGKVNWTGGRIIGDNSPVLNNFTGALFDAQTDATLFDSNDATVKTFNNSGLVRKSAGAGTSSWQGLFNNEGTLGALSGTLALAGGGQSTGSFTNATGATLEFTGGTQVLTNGASFSGAGTNRINGGTVSVLTNATVTAAGTFELVTGTLGGDGVFSAPAGSQFNWKGGVMGGSGKTTIATGATLVVSEVADKSLNRRLDNAGTLTWTAGRIIGDNTPVLNNLGGGLFDVQTDTTLFESNDQTIKTFNNSGTVRKSAGTGTTVFNGTFNNSAILELKKGILSLPSGYAPAAGSSLKVSIGGLTAGTDFGQLQVTGVASLAGALEVAVTGGFVPAVDNAFAIVTAGTRAGTFGSAAGLVVNAQRQLNPLYGSGGVSLITSGQTTVGTSVFHHGVPYTSRTNSPWAAELLVGFLHFYDFEASGTLDRSVATNSAALHSQAGGATDSVDADDGAVDGSGNNGSSLRADGSGTELVFGFQTNSIQPYPIQAGIVFTDGGGRVIFEAIAADGTSLGSVTNGPFTSSTFEGDVTNDRFFGVENAGGIAAIKITSESGGLEVDHLQFKIVGSTPLPPNPTLWLKAEGNGNDELSSQVPVPAGLFNGVSFAAGKVGQAFSLDGVDDFVVTPGVDLNSAEASGFTVEFWFKPSVNLGAGNGFTPLAMHRAAGESFEAVKNSFDFYYEAGFLQLAAGVNDDLGDPYRLGVSHQVNLVAGTWYHLAVVANTIYDEVKTYAVADIYLNGVKVGSGSAENLPGISGNTYVRARNAPVLLGRGEVGGTANYTAGLWDEFTVYVSALSGDQIAAIVRANDLGKSASSMQAAALPGGGYVLTWPDAYQGYVLEWSPALGAGANWRPVIERITAERGQQRVLIPAGTLSSRSVFYRLQRPPTRPTSGAIR